MEDYPLAGQGSAAKRHRQSEDARLRNKAVRSEVRTNIRKFLTAVEAKDKDGASQQLKAVTKLIDTAAGKGLYHSNTAARTKSRLTRKLNALT
jgi:small subunit ribosomal protein S20